MCGIVGVVARSPVNQLLYDGLLVLQHRGQDAAGIVTADGASFHMHKGGGMVRDVFRTRNMRSLAGHAGIAHTRYPTAGSAWSAAESQPFYVNSPFGIVLGHNGNLTNSEQLKNDLFRLDMRHVNTESDSEVLLNVLAHELAANTTNYRLDPATIFAAVSGVHRRCRGGIRPLVFGKIETPQGTEYMVASESVALDGLGFQLVRDVAPGEAIFIDLDGNFHSQQCAENPSLNPCLFEFVYLARPDSVIDGISVYETRLRMGESLGRKIEKDFANLDIDVVIPIPDSSRPAAMQLSNHLNLGYREGFIKNRYIGRTFIMPGQAIRRKSVRQKLNAIGMEFRGKNVLLVDDSIVRGTTSREIVQMARDAGARKVYFASAAPPVRYANVYGIDMPTRDELIASGRSHDEIAREIGCDALIYQELDALIGDVRSVNPSVTNFEASCFSGQYITGDVTQDYLDGVEAQRRDGAKAGTAAATQLDLGLELVE